MSLPICDLDAAGVLAASEGALRRRREAQVEDLLLMLQWADLHGADPQEQPGAVPARRGGDRLVELGADGTPLVQELCVHELAIARQTHPASTRATLGDVLDLRHRLPLTWAQVVALECEPWVACKVARMSRRLDRDQVGIVDQAVADAIGGESPGRVLTIAEAKVIEADPAAQVARFEEGRRRKGVWVSRTDLETGTRSVFSRLTPGDAVWIDAMVERIVDALLARPDVLRAHHPDLSVELDDLTHDELRAIAFGWLARPDDVCALLGLKQDELLPRRPHGRAVLYLHLHESALAGTSSAVARVEDLGPMLLEQVVSLLGHAHVTVKPVIDLDDHVSVNAYEFPATVTERTRLRCVGDVFPYAVGTNTITGRYDGDHAVPYDPLGPPGQTGDHNIAPLSRSHHRAKTIRGYRVRQLGDGAYLWTTPNGLRRLVDAGGTHELCASDAWRLEHADELDAAIQAMSEAS
ncbi:hypothetical protein [Nocardioides sp. T2.26MG-1]|uniref:hypothetical protein n=1 Tax=Nocardioides sp. T2.26MG-1 TaxID=3041166 RepID=UPI0024778C70|nr:hypothetical protein [Nocardioides sp. T2.26MG-1]CAI9405517.1 hypothetical protein HIDPHFAB_04400 [Nocardioides sp. T2.26MG-1]